MRTLNLVFASVLVGLLSACSDEQAQMKYEQYKQSLGSPSLLAVGQDSTLGNAPHRPLPSVAQLNLNSDKVALGEKLYNDGRLSKDGTVACAFCHQIARGGVDSLPVSIGVAGAKGNINAPTVLNSGFNFRQFWDGRAATLADQAKGPPENPVEMAHAWPAIVSELSQDKHYQQAFAALYADGITSNNIVDAIGEFERTLITPNAPFDRYLKGDQTAMNSQAIQGYQLFKDYGCVSCHQGINVGGNLYQKMGALVAYFDETHKGTAANQGLASRSKRVEDQNVFKVPSLRNVALTAPYFHDASASTLAEAVRIMSANQLGRVMPETEIEAIVAYLESLTGETPNNVASK